MKRAIFLAALLCLAVPAWAGEDPFADFRIPAHRTWSADATFSLSASRDITAMNPSGRSAARGRGSLARRWDSDALRYAFGIGAGGELNYQRSSYHDSYSPLLLEESRGRGQSTLESVSLSASVRTYPWSLPVGLDVSGATSGEYVQGWNERESDHWQPATESWTHVYNFDRRLQHRYSNSSTYSASIGLGRVRDATVVYRVHVLEGRLLQTGALARPLSRAARERLAALLVLSLDGSLSVAHERPTRYFWREVERVAREDGALAGDSFDAYSLARAMEEVAPRGYVSRQRGWFVGPSVRGSHAHQVAREDRHVLYRQEYGDSLLGANDHHAGLRRTSTYDMEWAGGQAEYHRPLGWAWQVDLSSALTSPIEHHYRGLSLQSTAALEWVLADRWSASGSVGHSRSYLRRGDRTLSDSYWSVGAAASLSYYLEDRTGLTLSVRETQSSSWPSSFRRSSSLDLSITHRFLGTVEAPGLIEPQRLAD
jgi:hypothetical protein